MPDGTALATALPDVADLVGAIAWPAVAVVLVVILRVPLRKLVDRIASSATKLSVGPSGLSADVEAAVTEVAPPSATVLDDLRRPAPGAHGQRCRHDVRAARARGALAEATPRPPSQAVAATVGLHGHEVIALLDDQPSRSARTHEHDLVTLSPSTLRSFTAASCGARVLFATSNCWTSCTRPSARPWWAGTGRAGPLDGPGR